MAVEQDPDLGDCEGFYKCQECGYRTIQQRGCPRCGGSVECDV